MSKRLGYIRVSSAEQNESRQLDGIELDKVFMDKVSGKNKEREGLKACIEYAREDDYLYIHSIDRLARNLCHLQEIVALFLANKVTVHFIKENLIFTHEKKINPFSTLLFHILGSFAEFERTIILDRQREGIEQAKLKGTKTGKPFGKPAIDYSLTEKVVKLYSHNFTISYISREIKLSRASVYKLLRSAGVSI